jgi:hypothetical protein
MEFLPAPSIIAVLKKKSCNIVLDEVVDCDCKQTFANKNKKEKGVALTNICPGVEGHWNQVVMRINWWTIGHPGSETRTGGSIGLKVDPYTYGPCMRENLRNPANLRKLRSGLWSFLKIVGQKITLKITNHIA